MFISPVQKFFMDVLRFRNVLYFILFFATFDQDTATRRVGKILVVVSGKTVSEILKIHTFLISIFNPLFNKITNNFKL